MGWLNAEQLRSIGFRSVADDALLSDKASYYNCANISVGPRSRIDDFCVLSAGEGGISIGANVHVAVFSSLIGRGRITLEDFSNISSRVAVYSSNDDYSGRSMTNPTVPPIFTAVTHSDVRVGRHVVIGSGSVILPGVTLHEGAAVGALSLVRSDCAAFQVYAGAPARVVGARGRHLLELEQNYLSSLPRTPL